MAKVLTEDIRNNKKYNQKFLKYTSNISNEAYVKWTNPNSIAETDKYDWFAWPFKNGSSELATTTKEQNFDAELQVYSFFFALAI